MRAEGLETFDPEIKNIIRTFSPVSAPFYVLPFQTALFPSVTVCNWSVDTVPVTCYFDEGQTLTLSE
jgi:hypothetical protein